jgi:hypothetical protein
LKVLGCEYRVWTLDFLGQGISLPSQDPALSDVQRSGLEVWGFEEESQS